MLGRYITCGLAVLLLTTLSAHGRGAQGNFAKLEAAVRIARERALAPPDERQAMANAIRGYLNTIDPYSSYITREEYASLHNAPKHYCGVGMDLIQGPGGLFHCLPYSGSPAEKAGIMPGDVLITVDGRSVEQYPPLVLETLIRGEAGSTVSLGVISTGKIRSFSIRRAAVSRASAELVKGGKIPRIRIWRFDGNTLEQLGKCLEKLAPDSPLILDLRGNTGGDLNAAAACAELFLPEESVIATLEDREGAPRVFRAPLGLADLTRPMALWQDAFTASAAEVFCAALHDNGAAQSIGQTTFGKGIAQSHIPAGDKDFFVITTGRLLRPTGEAFHHLGLEPDHYISPGKEPVEQYYLRKTYEILDILP